MFLFNLTLSSKGLGLANMFIEDTVNHLTSYLWILLGAHS